MGGWGGVGLMGGGIRGHGPLGPHTGLRVPRHLSSSHTRLDRRHPTVSSSSTEYSSQPRTSRPQCSRSVERSRLSRALVTEEKRALVTEESSNLCSNLPHQSSTLFGPLRSALQGQTQVGGFASRMRHDTLFPSYTTLDKGPATEANTRGLRVLEATTAKTRGLRALALLGLRALALLAMLWRLVVLAPCSLAAVSCSPSSTLSSSYSNVKTLAVHERAEVAQLEPIWRQGSAMMVDGGKKVIQQGGREAPKFLIGGSAWLTCKALFAKFEANWMLYSTIPVVAGLLNWATNKLAVAMIFYPLNFWGLKIRTWPETPVGLIGWTGIVPVKARTMAQRMVRMVTTSLIDVTQVAKRISPDAILELFGPHMPSALEKAAGEAGVAWLTSTPLTYGLVASASDRFVRSFTIKMQDNIKDIMDLENLVVEKFVKEKKLLVELFQTCGKVELAFIVRSGLYLGFLLGIFQMMVWLCWDPWWSLAVGGAAVGYVTNFIAIKSIFEPVQPVKVGPWTIQGLFLTRQYQVSAQFAEFLHQKVLTPEAIWQEILYGSRKDKFRQLLDQHVQQFAGDFVNSVGLMERKTPSGRPIKELITANILSFLESEHPKLHKYMDKSLDLEATMRTKMRGMSSEQFEGVLHPIFQEDELTLILTGAVLGLIVGFLQSLAPY